MNINEGVFVSIQLGNQNLKYNVWYVASWWTDIKSLRQAWGQFNLTFWYVVILRKTKLDLKWDFELGLKCLLNEVEKV